DVEIAANAVDVGFRSPVSASVIRVRMSEGNVNAGNFFVLQNISDHVGTSGVGADGEFAHPIAVLVGRSISAKFFQQLFVFAPKIDNAVVADFDRQRRILQITV